MYYTQERAGTRDKDAGRVTRVDDEATRRTVQKRRTSMERDGRTEGRKEEKRYTSIVMTLMIFTVLLIMNINKY